MSIRTECLGLYAEHTHECKKCGAPCDDMGYSAVQLRGHFWTLVNFSSVGYSVGLYGSRNWQWIALQFIIVEIARNLVKIHSYLTRIIGCPSFGRASKLAGVSAAGASMGFPSVSCA